MGAVSLPLALWDLYNARVIESMEWRGALRTSLAIPGRGHRAEIVEWSAYFVAMPVANSL
jgi:hypothetical protein